MHCKLVFFSANIRRKFSKCKESTQSLPHFASVSFRFSSKRTEKASIKNMNFETRIRFFVENTEYFAYFFAVFSYFCSHIILPEPYKNQSELNSYILLSPTNL